MRIICRRTRSGVIKFDFVEVHPGVQRQGDELWPVVNIDSILQPAGCLDFFQFFVDLFALDLFVYVDG